MRYRAIILLAALLVIPASASGTGSWWDNSRAGEGLAPGTDTPDEKNAAVLSWSPQAVDHIYVNDTESKTIAYSITTSLPMEVNSWTLDGVPVSGATSENTVSYMHTWDSKSAGFHTLAYRGSRNSSEVAFRWYVNIYDMERYRGGNIFDVVDDVLENHAVDVKVRMLKYTISKHGSKSNLTIEKINRLYDEIARQQGSDENLRPKSLRAEAGLEKYIPSMKEGQRNAKYRVKLTKEIIKIAREDLNDGRLAREFKELSDVEGHYGEKKKENDGTDKGEGKELNKDAPDVKKKYDNDTSRTSKSESMKSGEGQRSGRGGDSANSGDTGNAGDIESRGISGEDRDKGNSGNKGNSKDQGRSGGSGDTGNSGSSRDSGNKGGSESGGRSGNEGNKGNSGNKKV